MVGIRHFVSSVTEYTAGASLGSSSRKIPFYSLLVSPMKPKTKNKLPDPTRASVLCDTGAPLSLAPLSIARELKIKIDKSCTRLVRGANGKRLNLIGMGFVYMKAPASPLWKRVEVVRGGNNKNRVEFPPSTCRPQEPHPAIRQFPEISW